MKITLDGSIIQCLHCKKEDLPYYREPTVNYSNQENMDIFGYYIQCNSCKWHFAYVRKEQTMRYKKFTKDGVIQEKPKICIAGFYDLENQPNYDL